MQLETAVGWVDAERLVVNKTEQEIPCGHLTTTAYFLDGVLVKKDQHVAVSEDAMPMSGRADM